MAVKTRAELKAENSSDFPDNTTRLISAADLRGQMDDTADSALFPEDFAAGVIDASDVQFVAAGSISATNVQAAIEEVAAEAGGVSDAPYGPAWDGVDTLSPSQSAVYDKLQSLGPWATGTDLANATGTLDAARIADASLSIAQTSGLQTALDAKANVSHTHASGDISGLGTMATQDANSVAITGGTVAAATLTGTIADGRISGAYTGFSDITLSGDLIGTGSTLRIKTNTADAADNKSIAVMGGGAGLTSRGAVVQACGNEFVGNTGNLLLSAGTAGTIKFNGVDIGTAATVNTGTSGATIPLLNGANTWSGAQTFAGITNSGTYTLTASTATAGRIGSDADTKVVNIAGGSTASSTNGATINLFGNSHASTPGQLQLTSGTASTATQFVGGGGAATVFTIRNATADAADSGALHLSGGGGTTPATSRGAYISSYGNEHATEPGNLLLASGTTGTIKLNGTSVGTAATVNTGTSGATIPLLNGANVWGAAQTLTSIALAGPVTMSAAPSSIVTNTSDGTDTKALHLGAGGAATADRGAVLLMYGNENGSAPGRFSLQSGDQTATANTINYIIGGAAAGTKIEFRNGTANGSDSGVICLAGGGGVTDNGRGAYIDLHGNEHASNGGHIIMAAGAPATPGQVRILTSTLVPAASTTARAMMNLIVGPAPTSPNDGDVWLESNTTTGLKIRLAGATKTITVS